MYERVWIVSSWYKEQPKSGTPNWATAVFREEQEARELEEKMRDERSDISYVFVSDHAVKQ